MAISWLKAPIIPQGQKFQSPVLGFRRLLRTLVSAVRRLPRRFAPRNDMRPDRPFFNFNDIGGGSRTMRRSRIVIMAVSLAATLLAVGLPAALAEGISGVRFIDDNTIEVILTGRPEKDVTTHDSRRRMGRSKW